MKVMLRIWMILPVSLTCAVAQQAPFPSPNPLQYGTGTILNGLYKNECMGIAIAIPPGWNGRKLPGDSDTSVIGSHMPDGSITLLNMYQNSDPPSGTGVVLIAQDNNRFRGTAREFVVRQVQSLADKDPGRRLVLRSGAPVMYGGRQFYRSDYKQNLTNGDDMYLSYVFTIFRGHLFGGFLSARSTAGLEEAANSMQTVSFAQDQVNPACVEGDNSQTGRMVGVIGSVVSGTPRPGGRVRVSAMVATGLLVKRVEPQYPEDAKKAGVQGTVRLQIGVSKEGDVEPNIAVVAGDPKLVPAALDAVKNWKFKPYLLNGQPVAIDTLVTITFDPLGPSQ